MHGVDSRVARRYEPLARHHTLLSSFVIAAALHLLFSIVWCTTRNCRVVPRHNLLRGCDLIFSGMRVVCVSIVCSQVCPNCQCNSNGILKQRHHAPRAGNDAKPIACDTSSWFVGACTFDYPCMPFSPNGNTKSAQNAHAKTRTRQVQ
jgi:hypothetical protein